MKNLNKRTKIIIIGVLSFVLLIGGTGIVLYARDRRRQEQLRQEVLTVYESIKIPDAIKYNEKELEEHNDLLKQKEEALNKKDMPNLRALQPKLDELHKKVVDRLKREDDERKAKEEAVKQAQVEREVQEQAQNNVNHYAYSADNSSWNNSSPSYSGSNEVNSSSSGGSSNNSWEKPWESGCTQWGNCSSWDDDFEGGNW